MKINEIPIGLAGHFYRSPMLFGDHDPRGKVLAEYRQNGVSVIVLLAEDEEC